MTQAPDDVVRRRRAVYAALLTVFPADRALQAVAVWDRDYRHGRSPYDGLNVFARQVCGQFGENGRHRELIQRLMECFFAPESALPPDPGAHDADAQRSATPAQAPGAHAYAAQAVQAPHAPPVRPDLAGLRHVAPPAHVATWLKVIQRLVAELQPHDRGAAIALVRAMLQGATAVGVDPVARELVRQALEGKFNERLFHVTEAHLHALLNFAYVHAATAVGPVVADRILSAAVTAVDAMPESTLYAPRKLL